MPEPVGIATTKATEARSTPVESLSAGDMPAPSAETSPPGRIQTGETLGSAWIGSQPAEAGIHRRTRTARAAGSGNLLRVEEDVLLKAGAAGLEEAESHIGVAMAAGHILVGSRHAALLETEGLTATRTRSSAYLKVAVPNPEDPAAIPALIERLKARGASDISADDVIQSAGLSGDPAVGRGVAWHLDNLGLLPGHKAGADINAAGGWEHQTDASAALIALLDTGIDQNEPELVASLKSFPNEIAEDGIDNDGNGYVDDVLGYDFIDDDSFPEDVTNHGTMCARFMAEEGNNGLHSSGVAWKASILNCKVLDQNGLGNVSDAIDAIDYAIASGARVINLSWTTPTASPLLSAALKKANDAGIIIVCAAGSYDNRLDPPPLVPVPIPAPASIDLPLLVSVAASLADDSLAGFTLTDPVKVDLAAPGAEGSSYSAAMVSASVALAISKYPAETPQRIVRRLLENVDPIPGGAAALASGGRLNLGKMLSPDQPAAPHDLFAARRVIPDSAGRWSGRNDGAGTEPLDTSFGISPAPQRTVWFEWTAPWAGKLTLTPKAISGTVYLRVFRETNGQPASLISQSSAGKVLTVTVTQGQKLFWMLDSSTALASGLQLAWQLPPPNDAVATAPLITSFPFVVTGNTLGATREKAENGKWHAKYLPGESIWWKIQPSKDMQLVLSIPVGARAYLLPTKGKAATFPKNYQNLNSSGMPLYLKANKIYALLVVPATAAGSGPMTIGGCEVGQVAITTQPEPLLVLRGEGAGLGVEVAGGIQNFFPAYQWYKNDQLIPNAQASGIGFFPVNEDSFGTYHVVVSNQLGSATSRKVTVGPRDEKPRIAQYVPKHRLIHGQTLQLEAEFSNFGSMSYAWSKDGQPVTGGAGSQFSVLDIGTTGAGRYEVTATNARGSTTAGFDVDVMATPWKHWLERTPGSKDRGPITQMSTQGRKVTALTSDEWLFSTDAGQSWTSEPMPSRFAASSGASLPDGTLLVHGSSFEGYYGDATTWRKVAGGSWAKVPTEGTLPDGTRRVFIPQQIETLDEKFYVSGYLEEAPYLNVVFESTDGLTWTGLEHPATPGSFFSIQVMQRFSDSLAFTYWRNSSDQNALVLKSGGTRQVVPLGSGRELLEIDGTYLTNIHLVLSDFAEIKSAGNGLLKGIADDGDLISGLSQDQFTSKRLGFKSYTRSGNRWILGYPDGSFWSGEDLFQAPVANTTLGVGSLKAFNNEFIASGLQSSDGVDWRKLGPVTGEVVAQAGDHFMLKYANPLRHSFDNDDSALAVFSAAIHPVGGVNGTTSALQGDFWSGPDAVFRSYSSYGSVDVKLTQFMRPGPNGAAMQDLNIGRDWTFITDAKKIGERWFVRGANLNNVPFLVSSGDGTVWTDSKLLDGSVVGGIPGLYVAVRNSGRAFISSDGVRWKPAVLRGLPGTPNEITAYRGHLMARHQRDLYVSLNGTDWHLASAEVAFDQLAANRHTILGRTSTGRILQPDGETESGPRLELAESLRKVSVPLHQPFTFALTASDADNDLVAVDCLVNGQLHSTRSVAPFEFTVDGSVAGSMAMEFVARDSRGRIARSTALLNVLPFGVTESTPAMIASTPQTVRFKGRLYCWNPQATFYSYLHASDDGDFWTPVGLPNFLGQSFTANDKAMIVAGLAGLMVSTDGVTWVQIGFDNTNQTVPKVVLHGDVFEVTDYVGKWVSTDGLNWTPATGPLHDPNAVWNGDLHGVRGNLQVTTDGGRNWITIPGSPVPSSLNMVAVDAGFLLFGSYGSPAKHGIHLLKKGEFTTSLLHEATTTWAGLFAKQTGGLVLFGEAGVSLFSTADGLTITPHTWPPNLYQPTFVHHGGEWLAISNDRISASPDLQNWRMIFDFIAAAHPWGANGYSIPSVSPHGGGSIVVSDLSSGLMNRRFIVHPDLTVTPSPYRYNAWDSPQNTPGGLPAARNGGDRFKNRVIVLDDWINSKPAGIAGEWTRAGLIPGTGYVPPVEHEWPLYFRDMYAATAIHAASANRWVMLRKSYSSADNSNMVIHSEDGENFKVNYWTGPIPLAQVTLLEGSADGFLAGATEGRVLRSANGFDWTVHPVSATMEITEIFRFNGRWHVAGYHPTNWNNGNPIQARNEIWSSVDGATWQKTWEGPAAGSATLSGPVIANGKAWIRHQTLGVLKSTDGLNWAFDPAGQNPSEYSTAFVLRGAHPQGLLATHAWTPGKLYLINADTWQVIRSYDFSGIEIVWIDGWPFMKSLGRLVEWTEADPRITAISAPGATPSVGDVVQVQVSALEVPATPTPLRLFLTGQGMTGHPGDHDLGTVNWEQGVVQGDGSRRFAVAIPPTVDPGSFRVGGELLVSNAADLGLQNNLLATTAAPLVIPGRQLLVTQTGSGTVTRNDTRTLLPRGIQIELAATPAAGGSFGRWNANGSSHMSPEYSFTLLEDTTVEAIFTGGSLESLRTAAFAGAPAGTDTSWGGDADKDGVINWHEILLGSNPLSPGASGLVPVRQGSSLKLTYRRLQGATAASAVVPEFSNDIVAWSEDAPFTVTEEVTGASDGYEMVELTIPLVGGPPAGFVRLRLPPLPQP